jgi:hypothetical protein
VLAEGATTSASYSILPGHVYSFTVAAVDGAGAPQVVSPPYEIAFKPARARLGLTAARSGPQLVFTAAVRASDSPTLRGQALVLESFDGKRWRRVGDALTRNDGRARFAFRAARGNYRVRARLLGSDELQPAVSGALTLRVGTPAARTLTTLSR